jgi:hypothetical protein
VNDEKRHPIPLPDHPRRSLTPPAQLPPRPVPPQRALTPGARKAVKNDFELDASTPARNETAAVYSSLLSVFDAMSQAERFEFVELARVFAGLDAHKRNVAMIALRNLADI